MDLQGISNYKNSTNICQNSTCLNFLYSDAVADSGATDDMTPHADLFESITYYDTNNKYQPQVMLGDEETFHPIVGYGYMNYSLNGHRIRRRGLYIPGLGNTTLLSIKQHMQYKGNYFHAENNVASLAFPTFTIDLNTDDEISAEIESAHDDQILEYDEQSSEAVPSNPTTAILPLVSRNVKEYIPPAHHHEFKESILIQKLSPTATIPSQGTPGSAGFDVTTTATIKLEPGEIMKIPTGLATALPKDMYLRIAPRSSLALKHITVEGGVVDSDYRGEIKVLLKNNGSRAYQFHPKDKVAQFIFEKISIPHFQLTASLPSTDRNMGGFGSTGVSAAAKRAKYSPIDTFRLSRKHVLIVDNTNPWRPRARRVVRPLVSNKIQPEEFEPALENLKDLNIITTHEIDEAEESPLDPILEVNSEVIKVAPSPAPTDIPLAHPLPTVPEQSPLLATEESTTTTPSFSIDDSPATATPALESPREHSITNTSTTSSHVIDENETTPTSSILEMQHPPIPSDTMEDTTTSPSTSPEEILPPLSPVDTVNNALPAKVVLSRDSLHRSIGFLNSRLLLKHLDSLSTGTVQIQRLSTANTVDPGEVASFNQTRKPPESSIRPSKYSDVWHMDIGYGPCTSIGGVKYTLLLVDKHSRYKFLFGLKNLTNSLVEAMKKFLLRCGQQPKLIRTDYDHKLMGGDLAALLLENNIPVESAPPRRQNQNGLVERHWQTLVNMSRNWLTSSMLPTKYWWFALKRACEVSNVMPTMINNKVSTPYELVYKRKVDYRCLLPQFCLAYIRQVREEGGSHKNKWLNKNLKCILVGKCDKSDSLLFYHPPSKQILSCADGYRFDTTSPAGPQFGEHFDGDFIFTTKSAMSTIHRPPKHDENSTAFIQDEENKDQYHQVTILSVPIDDDKEPYTVQYVNSGNIIQCFEHELRDHDPSVSPIDVPTATPHAPFPHMQWLHHKSKVTLYLPTIMPKPKQGHLIYDETTKEWSFKPGRKLTSKTEPISLPNFEEIGPSMVNNKKLFKGWIQSGRALSARRMRATSNLIANLIVNRKVSAAGLKLLEAPTLLKHHKLHPEDKDIWDASYKDEYDGLVNINTWDVITEDEYKKAKHIFGNLLPTMAIAVIKYDEKGKPTRAKYRIVALGNLDPNQWDKNDCYAPVLSQLNTPHGLGSGT